MTVNRIVSSLKDKPFPPPLGEGSSITDYTHDNNCTYCTDCLNYSIGEIDYSTRF